jgi:glycine/serine hydroxymethyltransferase
MYGVTALFGHAVTLDAAKNVSLKKVFSVKFKNYFKKVLEIKKIMSLSAISTASTTEGYSMLL